MHPEATPPAQTATVPRFCRLKLAVTLVIAVRVTLQVGLAPEDAQAPPQPTNTDPAVGVSVNVTETVLVG